MNRRKFINGITLGSAGLLLPNWVGAAGCTAEDLIPFNAQESTFSKRLEVVGRALEMEGYYVWCTSPIEASDGKIHLFFSRWTSDKKMSGWINGSEIAHAVADSATSPFQYRETIFAPRGGGFWDGTSCHNPLITKVGTKYCLFYMGNSNGKTNTKRIGLALADSLDGPWSRPAEPLLTPGAAGEWDDHCTTNPAFVQHPDGRFFLFYKSWNTTDYEKAAGAQIRGNRKYGLAIANQLEGPYVKVGSNPVIDFSDKGLNRQLEDAFVWIENGHFKMLARDMGFYNHENGLLLHSDDGIKWADPEIAYYGADHYLSQPPAASWLKRYGRFERPQLLFQNGKPAYLFTASQGGKYMTSSSFIFKIT